MVAACQFISYNKAGDVQFYLCDLNGSSGRFGFGGDGSRGTGEPVVDELLGIVLSDSCWLASGQGNKWMNGKSQSVGRKPETKLSSVSAWANGIDRWVTMNEGIEEEDIPLVDMMKDL